MALALPAVDGVYTVDVSDTVVITFRLTGDMVTKLKERLEETEPALPGMPQPSIHHLARSMVIQSIEGQGPRRIAELEREVLQIRDKWLRSVAEFERYKNRMEKGEEE